jgi:hypothetical protein
MFFDDGIGWGFRGKDASLLVARAQWDAGRVRMAVKELWSGRGRPALKLECIGLGGRKFETEVAV